MGLRLRSNEASRLFARKPSGRRVFCRWAVLTRFVASRASASPLWGCSSLAALPTAKIPRRSTPRNFQTGS